MSRTTLFSVPGGDTTQILKTAGALRCLGVQVDISTDLHSDFRGYDLVHLFNLMRPQEVFLQASRAKKAGKPVALSTIYGPYVEFDRMARGGLAGAIARALPHSTFEYLKIAARAVINHEINPGTYQIVTKGYRPLQEKIISLTDILLPNSESELTRVRMDFPAASAIPGIVVPNAVDIDRFDYDRVVVSQSIKPYTGCILSVGRIEGRKCQLQLVRAMRGLDAQLVIIGQPAPNHLKYFEQVKEEAGSNVEFLGQIDHELLPEYYKAAKTHCLVSWMETPGLSSLEAAAMGCNIVITSKGDTQDYFRDQATYCDPNSVQSIREAIQHALSEPTQTDLRNRVRTDYTWEKAAMATLAAYDHVLRIPTHLK
nr:glycosyltransferase family 4 protein [uncultured Holophaga sp.]